MAEIRHRSPVEIAQKTLRELRRGATIARDGGPRPLWTFVREEGVRNTIVRFAPTPSADRARVECNVCGWSEVPHALQRRLRQLRRVLPALHAVSASSGCIADELERLGSGRGRRLLFAPEPGVRLLLERRVECLEGVDHQPINELVLPIEDIQRLSFADDSVDFFSCFHVLEHVPDDRAALSALARVLHSRGRAVFNVPMTFGRRETVVFGRANALANDPWFDYGEEFPERSVASGSSGTGYRFKSVMTKELYARLRLKDEMIVWLGHPAPGELARIRDHAGLVLAKAS
jgi:Methyltransferase domain